MTQAHTIRQHLAAQRLQQRALHYALRSASPQATRMARKAGLKTKFLSPRFMPAGTTTYPVITYESNAVDVFEEVDTSNNSKTVFEKE